MSESNKMLVGKKQIKQILIQFIDPGADLRDEVGNLWYDGLTEEQRKTIIAEIKADMKRHPDWWKGLPVYDNPEYLDEFIEA